MHYTKTTGWSSRGEGGGGEEEVTERCWTKANNFFFFLLPYIDVHVAEIRAKAHLMIIDLLQREDGKQLQKREREDLKKMDIVAIAMSRPTMPTHYLIRKVSSKRRRSGREKGPQTFFFLFHEYCFDYCFLRCAQIVGAQLLNA